MTPRATIPVTVLTGFLGSGKTSLLRHSLASTAMADTAVLVNEVGEIALDHELLSEVREDLIVLGSGCICCSMRNDLMRALCELAVGRDRGTLPPFSRVVVETTGLADPVPLVKTLVQNGVVASRFRLESVVTTVDAALGRTTLVAHAEANKQVALADRIVVTKCDLATEGDLAALEAVLAAQNPMAARERSSIRAFAPLHAPQLDVVSSAASDSALMDGPLAHADTHGILTTSVRFSAPLSLEKFGLWHRMTAMVHGEHVLRIKGILSVSALPNPIVVHSAQHVMYPVAHLERWRSAPSSRVVMIARGVEPALWRSIEASLRAVA